MTIGSTTIGSAVATDMNEGIIARFRTMARGRCPGESRGTLLLPSRP